METQEKSKVIAPTYIEFGNYVQGNKRKIKFNKNNPNHIKMFEKFYGQRLSCRSTNLKQNKKWKRNYSNTI